MAAETLNSRIRRSSNQNNSELFLCVYYELSPYVIRLISLQAREIAFNYHPQVPHGTRGLRR